MRTRLLWRVARNCASSMRGDKHLRAIFISEQSLGSVTLVETPSLL